MRYIVITATLIVITALVGCTKEEQPYVSPEATVETFAAKMAEGDYEGAMNCYNEESTLFIGDEVAGLTEDELQNLFLKSLENTSEPYTENEPENVRLVSAVVTYELGGIPHTHHLAVENGEWKINISGSAPLPAGGLTYGDNGE
ncbi:MAG: hypothetical protein GY771_05505 [bacterium]|nr:hypothetical protein [bacterium]